MGNAKIVEAKQFRVDLEFGGVPVILEARIFFARDGSISAVRNLRLLDVVGEPFKRVDSGKYESEVALAGDAKEQEHE